MTRKTLRITNLDVKLTVSGKKFKVTKAKTLSLMELIGLELKRQKNLKYSKLSLKLSLSLLVMEISI